MGVKDERVADYAGSLAAPTPTPGGGSASALVGSLAAALARMVASLGIGKAGFEAVQEDLRRLDARGAELQARLLSLADEDSAAYEAVLGAMHLPRTSDEERAARVEAMQSAYRRATEVPLATAEACLEVLGLAAEAAEKGNRAATTDAGVAALFAEAALRGASLNVRVNLASIRDETYRARAEERLDHIMKDAAHHARKTMALVERRL